MNDLMKLKTKLGDKLRRGNGGGWESDWNAIREAFPGWAGSKEGTGWSENSIAEIATSFAIWILYAFHQANAAALTNLNNPKSETAETDAINAAVKRDAIWNEAIALTFPLLDKLGHYEITDPAESIGLLRLMLNGDDISAAGSDAFDDWVSNLRRRIGLIEPEPDDDATRCDNCDAAILDVDVKTYSAAPGVPFVPICSLNCAAELDRKHQDARQPIATVYEGGVAVRGWDPAEPYPDDATQNRVIDSINHALAAAAETPADNAAGGVKSDNALGEILGTHKIRKTAEGVEYWGEDTERSPANCRRCDNCKRRFTGPAKLDAKFTFCGDYCQSQFTPEAGSDPGAVLHPRK